MTSFKKLAGTIGLVFLAIALVALVPCMQRRRSNDGLNLSQGHLKTIAHGLRAYHDIYKKLPSAVVRNKAGEPLYSWRVALLPFVEQGELYMRFKLDEPWDSPHNHALLKETPLCYASLFDDRVGMTNYQVFVGPGTAFERPRLTWQDFTDGPEQTILVVEAPPAVAWTKPVDLEYDPNRSLPALDAGFRKPLYLGCYQLSMMPAFNACFGDGKVRFLPTNIDEPTLRALITRNGGEAVNLAALE
jgi:hypothetical protein